MALPEGVVSILAPNPSIMTGAGTNSYIVAGSPGGSVIIDPGPDDTAHIARLAQVAASYKGLRGILITHGHPDHDEGAAHLHALTGAPIIAWSRDGVPSATALLADGDEAPLPGRRLVALYTPGHRSDHLCFLLPDAGALFAGDLVAGSGTVVIAPPEGDMVTYLHSLRRLQSLDLRQILPAHGPLLDRPRVVLEEYIRHRLEREDQVLAALAAGQQVVPAIVAALYANVDPSLHLLAALTVTAHLLKLEAEGRVTRTAGSPVEGIWHLTARAENL